MKILVTGGIGNVGRPVVERLVQHGHKVKVIDRQTEASIEGARFAQCDITDFNALREQVRGQEAIIHLAGLPYPAAGTGSEIFRINSAGTFNVFEAAAQEGIRRVVCASSINAFGYNFGIKAFEIRYFPIDEEHPGFTTDPYSFSKQVVEEIAAYYWRREGISSVCLRLPLVANISEQMRPWVEKMINTYNQAKEQLLAMPEAEQQERIQKLVSEHEEMRSKRLEEIPWQERNNPFDLGDPFNIIIMFHTDFWANISGEDSAQAFEKAVLADYSGSHPLYVGEDQNFAGIEAETLARLYYPSVTARKRPLKGKECLVSFDKARQLIGFAPEHPVS